MHLQEINSIIKTTKAKTQDELIYKLAPKIRQWGLEYQNISTKKIFNYCDYLTLKMIWKWTCRRHPKKGRKWIKSKYFVTLNGKNWVFGAYQKENVYLCLPSHADTMLLKHSKLLNRKSPYAGDLKYWFERL
jgi:RNA-directed DNA polymerase